MKAARAQVPRPARAQVPRSARRASGLAMRGLLAAGAAWVAWAGLAASPARAETRPRYGGSVAAALLGAPASLDPVAARSHAELSLAGLLFDGLYRLDEQGAVVPQLAAGAPVLDAARGVLVIPLRQATFHDGTPITAAAVVASLSRVQKSAMAFVLAGVTDLRAVDGALEVSGAVDPTTLARRLALPQAGIVADQAPSADRAVGSGPFMLASLRRRERVVQLTAFAAYHAGRPYLDEVVLHWFDTPDGEARRFEIGASQISLRGVTAFAGAEPKFRADTVEGPAAVLVFVGFGNGHPEITGRREVRAALDLALARGGFSTLGAGEQVVPTRSPVPPQAGGPALPAAARGGDVTAALARMGQAASASPPLLPATVAAARLEILFDDSRPDDREVAERVVRALDKIGLTATVVAQSAPALRARVDRGACDLWIGQVSAPVHDAAVWQHLALAVGGGAAGRARGHRPDAGNPARRFELEQPIVPLYFRGLRASYRTDVRGLAFDPSGQLGFADLFLFGEPERSRRTSP
ncbi:MAG: hypothetical protein IPI49_18840 [Myxococcales bacterium]|nr:hypothetical protein [Myxococcales bacterium]